jgi:cold shock CspA family protein
MFASAAGADLFVQISRCVDGIDALQEGQRVEFVERESRRKPGYEAAHRTSPYCDSALPGVHNPLEDVMSSISRRSHRSQR